MPKICDNKSVGCIVEEDGRFAMIFRKNYPQAWAMIAGHVDDHGTPRDAARAEAREEGKLDLGRFVELPFGRIIDNPCKRDGGTHHEWHVFEVYDWAGTLTASSDAKRAEWKSQEELLGLAARTEYFMQKHTIQFEEVGRLTTAIFGAFKEPNTDLEWLENPGLEPVWYYILKKLGKI